MHKNQTRMEKNQSHQYQDEDQESKMQEKSPNTPKGPGAVEDMIVEMQASGQKGGFLPKVEAKFNDFTRNRFQMTDQDAIQALYKWRKSL